MIRAALRLGIALVLLFAVSAATPPQTVRPTDRPFLYRIEGKPASFLYGTIHVPDDRVLALRRADVLATELEFDLKTQEALRAGLTLPGNQTLSDVVPPELYKRLERYFTSRGAPLASFQRLKLVPLGAVLEMAGYRGGNRVALDEMLIADARRAGKPVEGLERAEEQLAALDALTPAEQLKVLDEELAELEKLAPGEPGPIEKMVRAYVAGDEKALWAESMAYVDPGDPVDAKFVDALFTQRNVRFAERIDQRLSAQPARAYFVAIGALHLFGPDGVIARLEKRGRTLVRLDGSATP